MDEGNGHDFHHQGCLDSHDRSLRGTLSSTALAGVSFAWRDATGKAVPPSLIVARSLRSGRDGTTTRTVRRLAIPSPDRYRLEATGCEPAPIASNSRLVLARPGGTPLILSVLWVVTAAVMLLASLVFSALSAFAQPAAAGVAEPAVGSPARTVILDAVRGELRLASDGSSRFKVFHLKTAGAWAYFEGNEIVQVEGREWQETDLTVKTLLREEDGRWRVRALWSLPGHERRSLRQFERPLAEFRALWQLPAGLFPQAIMQAGERARDGGRCDEGSTTVAFVGQAGQRSVAPRNGGGGGTGG